MLKTSAERNETLDEVAYPAELNGLARIISILRPG